jgi:cytochrome c oxidase subunit 2
MRRPPPARTTPTLGVLAALAGVVVLGGCSPADMMPESASEQGDAVLGLWSPAVVAALVVGSIVWALIVWSVIRYRKRSDTLPLQVEEHIPIEIAYTVAPIVIVVVLFVFGTLAYRDVSATVEQPDHTVEVIGFQWSWRFTYEGTDVVVQGTGEDNDGPELVLPVDRTTRLVLVSDDVAHSFWVPELLSKRDLIPGVDNEIDVTPTREGLFRGRCAEFCGLDHWRMYFQLRVVSGEEFDAWVAEQEALGG